MDEDGLKAIILIVIIVALIAVVVLPVVVIWIYILYQNSRRKKIVQRIVASRADLIGHKRWVPARYASQTKFDSLLKLFPWNGAGVMIIVPGSVLFLGETLSGTPLTLQFAPGNSRLHWLGKCPWPNGLISWLRFDTADQKHYFSSETGIFIFGSHQTTKAIYDEANRNFGAPAAQNL